MTGRSLAALLLATAVSLTAVADEAPYTWRSVTVGGGGFAPNVIYSEAEQGLAYLRTDMGGAYRWDSDAGRWIPLQDGMAESAYFGIESIAADPRDPNVVHMAVGMYKRDPAAMLRSFDRGDTWQITPVPFRMGGNEDGRGLGERLAIDPVDTDILFFGSRHDGLFRSVDRGLTWGPVASFPHHGLPAPEGWKSNGGVSFVVFGPAPDGAARSPTVFAGVADAVAAGVYRSDDAGVTWRLDRALQGLLPAKAAVGGGRLFVTFSDGIGPNGVTAGAVQRLDIARGEWTDVTPPMDDAEGGFMGVSVAGTDPDIVAVATMNRWEPGDTVFRSTDGGGHWTDLRARARLDVSAYPFLYWGRDAPEFGWWMAGLAIDPFDADTLVYTTGATVYRTLDAGADHTLWKPWVEGVEQTAVITLASLPENVSLLSGFGDISGFVHTDFERSPQVMFTHPVFANTNTIDFAGRAPHIVVRSGTQPHRGDPNDPTLAWSADHGFTWQPLTVPPLAVPGEPKQRYDRSGNHAIVVSADGETFMFMAPVPVISRDRGASWQAVEGLPLHARPVPDRVEPGRFYALDFDASVVYRSDDGGAHFYRLDTVGLPAGLASDRPTNRERKWPLLATPGRAGELWLFSGQGLFRSTDGGLSFTRVEGKAQPGCSLQVEQMDFGKAPGPDAPPLLFAIGRCDDLRAIWRSDDRGARWRRINDDDHEWGRRYRTLAGDRGQSGRVYLATDGRGILVGTPAD